MNPVTFLPVIHEYMVFLSSQALLPANGAFPFARGKMWQ
jgi:hypothetical protein